MISGGLGPPDHCQCRTLVTVYLSCFILNLFLFINDLSAIMMRVWIPLLEAFWPK